jgi:hypothetical protein
MRHHFHISYLVALEMKNKDEARQKAFSAPLLLLLKCKDIAVSNAASVLGRKKMRREMFQHP